VHLSIVAKPTTKDEQTMSDASKSTIPEWAKLQKTTEEDKNAPHLSIMKHAERVGVGPEELHQRFADRREKETLQG
jgi:hypothetical protein